MSANLTWAIQKSTNILVHISTVEKGVDCACICPACQTSLIAKKGEKNALHFAHLGNIHCETAEETALHKLAKQIIAANNHITLPDKNVFYYDEVLVESMHGSIKPDLILKSETKEIIVEVFVTHETTPSKETYIAALGLTAFEIDLSDTKRDISEATLRQILIETTYNKNWIHSKPVLDQAKHPFGRYMATLAMVLLGILLTIFFFMRRKRLRTKRRSRKLYD